MSFVDETEHSDALRETGFWGRQGAGCILVARSTGRILLPLRSDAVLEPHTWGVWGGAVDPDSEIEDSVKREVVEETGYEGDVELHPLCVFEDAASGFRYHNFIGIIDDEFEAVLNWESDEARWFDEGDWPDPLHFGLRYLLDQCPSPLSVIPSGPTI
jgi:8-oxo-dGTP pyrophosphatase MutT (NUDIX family)